MKKIGLALVAVAFVIAAGNLLNAGQVVTEQTAASAKQIKVSGEVETPMVSRDTGVNSVLDGAAQTGDSLWSPLITLNIDAALGDKISSFIKLQNRRLDDGIGTAANVDFMGGDNIDLSVKEAFLKLEKFIVQDLTFTYGLQNIKATLRDGEGAFYLDTNYASSNAVNGFLTEPDATATWQRHKDTSEFGGLRFDYGSLKNNNYQGALFTGTFQKNPAGLGLHDTTTLNGALFWYKLGDGKIVNVLLTKMGNHKAGSDIQTIGLGGIYNNVMPNLDLYGEFYSQTGDVAAGMSHAASAYRLGAKYDIKHSLKPYVDLSYWNLSGGGTATKNKNFVSMENVKSTMILEDAVFGLDLDSNYTAIKLATGITTKVDIDKDGSPEELNIKLLFGQFSLSDQPNSLTGVDDSLGTEINLLLTLQYNPSVAFTLGYATLSGGKFFTDAGTYGAAEDSMKMVTFGANVKF
jgi:hypothetical protein